MGWRIDSGADDHMTSTEAHRDTDSLLSEEQARQMRAEYGAARALFVAPEHALLGAAVGAVVLRPEDLNGAAAGEPFGVAVLGGLEFLAADVADRLVAQVAGQADEILLDTQSYAVGALEVVNAQPPEHWARILGRLGFFRAVDDDPTWLGPNATRFRRMALAAHEVAAEYERRHWWLRQESSARRALSIESREEVARRLDRIRELESRAEVIPVLQRQLAALQAEHDDIAMQAGIFESQAIAWERRWGALEQSFGFRLLDGLQRLRGAMAPPGSVRDQALDDVLGGLIRGDPGRAVRGVGRVLGNASWQLRRLPKVRAERRAAGRRRGLLEVRPVLPREPLAPRTSLVDVVICVHNAPEEVRRCLASVAAHSGAPYRLIIVDDGSADETRDLVATYATDHDATLFRAEVARGYTVAANQGIAATSAEFVVLLNSDTEVTPGWLDRLVACAESDPTIGMVGPLSNRASFQSVPRVADGDDWADNPLPDDIDLSAFATGLARHSPRVYPRVPILNGFCLLIKRAVFDAIGTFDEATFAEGYGEENDFALRARDAGWSLAVADDTFVAHEMSRSYTDERRRDLTVAANDLLVAKHGQDALDAVVAELTAGRVLEGIRAHAATLPERLRYVRRGREKYGDKSVLFLLPVVGAGGGGVFVVATARVLAAMGVRATIYNLPENQATFEVGFPDLDVPVVYGRDPELVEVARGFDAVVATAHFSVRSLLATYAELPDIVRAYFVQDFEPYFYPTGSAGEMAARNSYGLVPGVKRVATTAWVESELARQTGLDSTRIGAAVDVDLFGPRTRTTPSWPERPLRIAAMVRPESHYRGPHTTMAALRAVEHEFGERVEILLYGTTAGNPGFAELPRDFRFQLLGRLSQREMATLFNEIDVLLDASTFQAYGMAAVEAMNAGVAVVVPAKGGVSEYARDGENSLVVDTQDAGACAAAVARLVADDALRARIQQAALWEGPRHHPEATTYRFLEALFG
jgi:GT2 family glycosyltransferase/glycosyltransferase involved in cell wall biosynthesis